MIAARVCMIAYHVRSYIQVAKSHSFHLVSVFVHTTSLCSYITINNT